MTKGTDTYGLGIGIQLGGFAEWYQTRSRHRRQYLTDDLKSPAINTPAVVEATARWADLFKQGIAPPLGHVHYDTAPAAWGAGKLAIYSSDLAIDDAPSRSPGPFEWQLLPYPPGSEDAGQLQRHRLLRDEFQDARQGPRLGGHQVVDQQRQRRLLGRIGPGTYPARIDAVDHGYGTIGVQAARRRRSRCSRSTVAAPSRSRRGPRSRTRPRPRSRTATAARRRPRTRSRTSRRS